jgi:hypothetical protein
MLLPKLCRSEAYRIMMSMHRSAMPRLMAASVRRSISRLRIMLRMPPPTVPSTFSSGTTQSSKMSSLMVLARMPIFLVFSSVEKPGKPRSTTNVVMRSSTLAYTMKTSASGALVMSALRPLRMNLSPSLRANVRMPSTSVPLDGSVMPMAPTCSPVSTFGRYFSRWAGLAA